MDDWWGECGVGRGGLGHAGSPGLTHIFIIDLRCRSPFLGTHQKNLLSWCCGADSNSSILLVATLYGGFTVCQLYKLLYLYHLNLGDQ